MWLVFCSYERPTRSLCIHVGMTYWRLGCGLLALLLWVLVTPLPEPGVWGWSIIGARETKEECEAMRGARMDWQWTICAEMGE